jgi:hypothetical protein
VTAAFAAMAAVTVSVADASPAAGIIFIVLAGIFSKIRTIRFFTPFSIPILFGLCLVNMPAKTAAVIFFCCILTATVKKNFYHSFPVLLAFSFTAAVLCFENRPNSGSAWWVLILLLPAAAGVAPKNTVKGICIALAVSIPAMFGNGCQYIAAFLLPPLIPVLLYGNNAYIIFGRDKNAEKRNLKNRNG